MCKKIAAIDHAKEKSFIEGRVVYDDDKQKRHNHDRSSQELAANKSVGPAMPLIKIAHRIFSKRLTQKP